MKLWTIRMNNLLNRKRRSILFKSVSLSDLQSSSLLSHISITLGSFLFSLP